MNELVFIENGEAFTDSLKVAEVFGKQHKRVMQDIRGLECSEEFNRHNFVQVDYVDDRNRTYQKYLIKRDGLAFLIMGYTGKKAAEYKEGYIRAFNKMEQEIRKVPHRQRNYLLEVAQEEMGIAELMARVGGVKIGIASAVALDRSEKRTGESLAEYKALLPSAEHDTGHLNATQVGKKVGLSGMKANKKLKEIGLQYQEEYKPGKKQWRLTEIGKEYGEEFPYNRNGHSGYQIKWNDEVLDIMKEQPTAK